MARKPYDPLAHIPLPGLLREESAKARTLAERLEILLSLSERLHAAGQASPAQAQAADRREVVLAR